MALNAPGSAILADVPVTVGATWTWAEPAPEAQARPNRVSARTPVMVNVR